MPLGTLNIAKFCVLVLASLQLAGCGGGSDVVAVPESTPTTADGRRFALAAPANADTASTATKLFNFAEKTFPEYFPEHTTNIALTDWVYRYYPSTGAYLAVIDWHVYILGGPFGSTVKDVGEVTQFVDMVAQTNKPPTVRLTSPKVETYNAPASVSLAAEATDEDGNIARVEYYAGTTKIGESSIAPYSWNWTGISAGRYDITAVSVDNFNARTTSAPTTITVLLNQSPSIILTTPTNGSTYSAPAEVVVSANASDDGSISRVEFYSGSTKLGEDAIPPFNWSWSGIGAGIYKITAIAVDSLGIETISAPVTITVAPNQQPAVMLTSPVYGTALSAPATVAIAASALDDGSITKVEFFSGSTKLGEDTSSPYTFNWNGVPAGIYSLTARATDNNGAATTSTAISVTVTPAVSPAGTITAAQLAKCPTVNQSSAPNFYLCMIGGLTGSQVFDTSKPCTLSIASTGATTIQTGSETYEIATYGTVGFTKTVTQYSDHLSVLLWSPNSSRAPVFIEMSSVSASGKFFYVDGGTLQVDANQTDYRVTPYLKTSTSCVFNVPKI